MDELKGIGLKRNVGRKSKKAEEKKPHTNSPVVTQASKLRSEEIIEMVVKVKQSASIFKDEKLAKDLLNLILLPRDQEERQSWSTNIDSTNSFFQLYGLSTFQTRGFPQVLSS